MGFSGAGGRAALGCPAEPPLGPQGVEACYLLAAVEALLADLADFRRMRSRGWAPAGLALARAGVRSVAFLGPVIAGLWLAAGASLPAASLLSDRNGGFLQFYYPAGRYQVHAPAAGISEAMKRAIDAIEDPGAYTSPLTHLPISPVRVAGIFTLAPRALRGEGGELSGASGIAVQACKNFYGRPLVDVAGRLPRWLPVRTAAVEAATLVSKLAFEFQCGWAFERTSLLLGADRFSLSFYLNAVYFGRGAYGVQAAALTYFGKPARDLAPVEAALLAGLPQAPSRLDPWSDPDAVRARRGEVLRAMAREGYISEAEGIAMDGAPLGVLPAPIEPNARAEGLAPYTRYLMDWLEAHGFRGLSTAGLVVTTSLDPDRQRDLEGDVRAAVRGLESRRVNDGAAVVLDPRSGEVLAVAGGLQPVGDRPDAVTETPRQPGSALKPLLYACALEEGVLQPDERLDDTPRVIGGRPVANWDLDPVGRGMRPAREELSESRNAAAAELVERLTPEGLVACLRDRFGVGTDLRPEHHGVELGLGLAEMPVMELAAAYTPLANGGMYVEPSPVLRMQDRHGRELYRLRPTSGPKVLGDGTIAWVSGTLTAVSRKLGIPGEVATKTGTTPSSSFVVGYGSDLLLAAWLGRTEPGRGPLQIDDVEGRQAAWAIWRAQAARPRGSWVLGAE